MIHRTWKEHKNMVAKDTCPRCGALIAVSGIRKHQQTLVCRTRTEHQRLVAAGWCRANYYHVRQSKHLDFNTTTKHYVLAMTDYHGAGWGRSARVTSCRYIKEKYQVLQYSPHITQAEFDECGKLDEWDPRFQALYVLAKLAGD